MTDHEIEKLREKLGSEYSVKRMNGAITVELVDIWKGVEFASHIFDDEVYRVSEIVGDKIWNTKGTWFSKKVAKPSTESAYVEQLKAKAKELYGEIKDGDRFDRGKMGLNKTQTITLVGSTEFGWDYDEKHDQFFFGNLCLYNKGKWATRINEPIRVNISGFTLSNPYSTITFTTSHLIKSLDSDEFAKHIEEAIEAYLNKQ